MSNETVPETTVTEKYNSVYTFVFQGIRVVWSETAEIAVLRLFGLQIKGLSDLTEDSRVSIYIGQDYWYLL